jgi:hypothetical protein
MAKKKSKSSKADAIRVVVSLIYICMGVASVISALEALMRLDLVGILTSAVGVLMFVSGILCLAKLKTGVCRFFGILIFAVSAFNVVSALLGGAFEFTAMTQVLLAWLFIIVL